MNPPAPLLAMSEGQREILQKLSRSKTAPVREVTRAQVLLLAADGVANAQIAARTGAAVATVRSWRAQFAVDGLAKFGKVAKGRGRRPSIPPEKVDEILELTLHSKPTAAASPSSKQLAKTATDH